MNKIEQQIEGLRKARIADGVDLYPIDICLEAADTMQALYDVAKAAEAYRKNVGLPSAGKKLIEFTNALDNLRKHENN